MAWKAENGDGRRRNRWRIAAWALAAFILLLPALAMQATGEVDWDVADFAIFGAMLAGAGGTYELAARKSGDSVYRTAVGVALAAAFILVWMSLAVGIIGVEGNSADLMYAGVLAVGIVGAIIARFEPIGMSRALSGTALAQALVAAIALAAGFTGPRWPGEILILTGLFAALWLVSAWLFRQSARKQGPAGSAK